MPRTHRRITNLETIKNSISLISASYSITALNIATQIIIQIFNILTTPAHHLIKLLHHRPPYRLPTHIHRNETRRIKRPIPIAINLLKNQPQHRRINQLLTIFLRIFQLIAIELIGIQKLKQISQRIQLTRSLIATTILENCRPKNWQISILEIANKNRLLFCLRWLK